MFGSHWRKGKTAIIFPPRCVSCWLITQAVAFGFGIIMSWEHGSDFHAHPRQVRCVPKQLMFRICLKISSIFHYVAVTGYVLQDRISYTGIIYRPPLRLTAAGCAAALLRTVPRTAPDSAGFLIQIPLYCFVYKFFWYLRPSIRSVSHR